MKKIFISLIIALSALFTSAYADGDITIIIDGGEMSFDAAPFIEDGTTLVPMRGIFEKLGASVHWDGDTKTVTIETVKETPESSPEPTQASETMLGIPTPQPVEFMARELLPIGGEAIPYKENAVFYANFYGAVDKLKALEATYDEETELGVRISEDKDALYSDKAIKEVAWSEDISKDGGFTKYSVDLNKNNVYIKPDTTYYYGFYAVKDGEEHKGDRGSFKTLKSSITFPKPTAETENIKSNDVTFVGSYAEKDYIRIQSVDYGIYFGTSEEDIQKIGEVENISDDDRHFVISTDTSVPYYTYKDKYGTLQVGLGERVFGNQLFKCSAKDLGLKLEPETEYFFKFYVIWDNEEYTSEVNSFTTKSN